MQGMQEQGLPHNDYDQLYNARVEIISCETKLPGIIRTRPSAETSVLHCP
jgi:hypothetical protein